MTVLIGCSEQTTTVEVLASSDIHKLQNPMTSDRLTYSSIKPEFKSQLLEAEQDNSAC